MRLHWSQSSLCRNCKIVGGNHRFSLNIQQLNTNTQILVPQTHTCNVLYLSERLPMNKVTMFDFVFGYIHTIIISIILINVITIIIEMCSNRYIYIYIYMYIYIYICSFLYIYMSDVCRYIYIYIYIYKFEFIEMYYYFSFYS